MHETPVLETPLFVGPKVQSHDNAMDKIVNRFDVCLWQPLNCEDAMDKIVATNNEERVNVETKTNTNKKAALKVETKHCTIRLIRLDSILFDNSSDVNASESETETNVPDKSLDIPTNLSRLRPHNRQNRTTRHPRQASQNIEYSEANVPVSPVKNKSGYVKNIKPLASGPSEE